MKSIKTTCSLLSVCFLASQMMAGTNIVDYWVQGQGQVKQGYYKFGAGTPIYKQGNGWHGTMWGKAVYLQGDPTMSRFDAHEKVGSTLYYTGTFGGNMQENPDSSACFISPIVWLVDNMTVGAANETTYSVYNVNAKLRDNTVAYSATARVEYTAKYTAGTYYHPELGRYIEAQYGDVIYMKFWPRKDVSASLEEYWMVEGIGVIRAYGHINSHTEWYDPADVLYNQTIPGFGQSMPANPWHSVYPTPVNFSNGPRHTFVWNGAFEKTDGGGNHLTGWSASSGDCVAQTISPSVPTNPWGYNEAGAWGLCLRGSTGGGDSAADAISSYWWIPVSPGTTYTLSGWVWRTSTSDNVYVDLNDGNGASSTGSAATFTDVHAYAVSSGGWEYVSADITMPSNVYGVRVRCVRDGANNGNAYFDDVRLRPKL